MLCSPNICHPLAFSVFHTLLWVLQQNFPTYCSEWRQKSVNWRDAVNTLSNKDYKTTLCLYELHLLNSGMKVKCAAPSLRSWKNACRGARLAHCLGLSFSGTPYRSNRSPLFMLVLQDLWGERTEERERRGKREEVNCRDRSTVPFLGACQAEQGTVVLSGYSCHSRQRNRQKEVGFSCQGQISIRCSGRTGSSDASWQATPLRLNNY